MAVFAESDFARSTLPTHLLLPKVDPLYRLLCVHCNSGSIVFQRCLLIIQAIFASSLLLNFHPKSCAFFSWLLYLSLTLRNTWLVFILDWYFHHLLFYCFLLPHESASKPPSKGTVLTPSTVALKLQILWIYADAGFGKFFDPEGGWTLSAEIPALDTFARHTLFARHLYALLTPVGLRLLTPIVVYVEILSAPVALIASFFQKNELLLATIVTVFGLHTGIALAMSNSFLISAVACAAWLIFLPGPHTDSHHASTKWNFLEIVLIFTFVSGSLWFELLSEEGHRSANHVWSTLLHNRWNVFVGAEKYVTWEIAPGRLNDGTVVDVWSDAPLHWDMPQNGAPSTSTARGGRWRSFPYLAGKEGEDGKALWEYLCKQWDRKHPPEKCLLRYNFFIMQADVLPNMEFSPPKKSLIHSHICSGVQTDEEKNYDHQEKTHEDNGGEL